ncbi:hypothetical protein SKAU_G00258040 [Synaphobranchus kaupii]|uniref:Uncharacterized protein n=1 Tax=Synaphobranchus kaupii TaxID=118154 RepID=A0A9Q1IQG4_SYNKA|nr:hypothetical protein SKAU_G00258040 [Synaphobranchus kaupii]
MATGERAGSSPAFITACGYTVKPRPPLISDQQAAREWNCARHSSHAHGLASLATVAHIHPLWETETERHSDADPAHRLCQRESRVRQHLCYTSGFALSRWSNQALFGSRGLWKQTLPPSSAQCRPRQCANGSDTGY